MKQNLKQHAFQKFFQQEVIIAVKRMPSLVQDDWTWHMYDTVKGSIGLASRCYCIYVQRSSTSSNWIRALQIFFKNWGRKIYQRPFGGIQQILEGIAQRTCHFEIEQVMLCFTLYQQFCLTSRIFYWTFCLRPNYEQKKWVLWCFNY